MIKYVSWVLLAAFVLSLYVWQQTQSVRLGYKVDTLRRECDRWEQENKALRLSVNCLLALDRLDRVAQEKHLINPDAKTTIYLPG